MQSLVMRNYLRSHCYIFKYNLRKTQSWEQQGLWVKQCWEPTVASSPPAAKLGRIGAIALFSITLCSPLLKLYWHFIWFRINCYGKPFCFSTFSFKPLITVKLYKRPFYSLNTIKRFFVFVLLGRHITHLGINFNILVLLQYPPVY